jgi:hypothetical protein
MTARAEPRGSLARFGTTSRWDAWWLPPLRVGLGLGVLGLYAAVVVFLGNDYVYTQGGADYLSPFYSPNLRSLAGWNAPISTAIWVVWAPLGLRASCYYYRKAYYRAYFFSPPACAVAGPRRASYRGEARLPLLLQNAHRYFFYLATIVLGFLWYDAIRAFFFRGSDGALHAGLGLGTLVLLLNVVFLSGFTFGCNSLRHLVGGKLDCFTCSLAARSRHKLWQGVSFFNARHMEWAWISLFWVCASDLYIRLAAAGVFHDPRIF